MLCPFAPTECAAGPYADVDLARHLPAEAFKEYLASRQELVEQRRAAENDRELKEVPFLPPFPPTLELPCPHSPRLSASTRAPSLG